MARFAKRTALGTGRRRYLHTVPGRGGHDPTHVGWTVHGRRGVPVHRRLADFLEETLEQSRGRLADQQPAGQLSRVPVGVQRTLGYVHERAGTTADGAVLVEELELALEDVGPFVFPVLNVGRRNGPTYSRASSSSSTKTAPSAVVPARS